MGDKLLMLLVYPHTLHGDQIEEVSSFVIGPEDLIKEYREKFDPSQRWTTDPFGGELRRALSRAVITARKQS